MQNIAENKVQDQSNTTIAALQKSLQNLQQDHALDKERMLSTQKLNDNLERDRNRFIKLHSDEKEK